MHDLCEKTITRALSKEGLAVNLKERWNKQKRHKLTRKDKQTETHAIITSVLSKGDQVMGFTVKNHSPRQRVMLPDASNGADFLAHRA